MKALFYIPSARNLPVIHQWINRVDFIDKLIVRYHHKDEADDIATKFFFKHKYDYLIISTDDVLGTPDHIRLLLEDERKHNFPVVTGWCNHRKGYASVSVKPIDIKNFMNLKPFYRYNFVTNEDIIFGKYGFPFFKSWFNGLALTLIRKDVLKRVPFRSWLTTRDSFCKSKARKIKGRGSMQDLAFAEDCSKANIPITVDARIFLLHIFHTAKYVKLADWPGSRVKKKVDFIKAVHPL